MRKTSAEWAALGYLEKRLLPKDWVLDSWEGIARTIQRGDRPELEHIVIALRRGEPVPPAIQSYIAGILDKDGERRGRPKDPHEFTEQLAVIEGLERGKRLSSVEVGELDRGVKDRLFAAKVDQILSQGATLDEVLSEVAGAESKQVETIKRRYKHGRKFKWSLQKK